MASGKRDIRQEQTRKVRELPIPKVAPPEQTEYTCDVLVVGGGLAGLLAAVSAKEAGGDVILVDKGYPGYSGQSPWAGCQCFFDEGLGDSVEEYEFQMIFGNEYIANMNWARVWARESRKVYDKCVELGLVKRYPTMQETGDWVDGTIENDHLVEYNRKFMNEGRHAAYGRALKERNIPFVPHTMIMDVVEDEGRIKGAVGLHYKSGTILKFHAKAVILCTGAGSYKPSGFPASETTFDGEYIGYKHGLPLTGQEFEDYHMSNSLCPGNVLAMESSTYLEPYWLIPPGGITPETANEVIGREAKGIILPVFDSAFGVKKMKEPVLRYHGNPRRPAVESDPRVGHLGSPALKGDLFGAAPGIYSHYAGGIFCGLDDTEGKTAIPGLWVAGDGANGCMVSGGSKRCPGGMTSNLAGVQGKLAAEAAVAYARQMPQAVMPVEKVRQLEEEILAPLQVEKGYDPNWARDMLTAIAGPYWVVVAKNEAALKNALFQVENLRDNVIPKLRADSGHDLRLCHEMRHKVLIAELKIRASLERKESRGYHFRTDYPYRDDNYLCYFTLRKGEGGRVKIDRVDIKDEWKGNTSLPYEVRYGAWQFPGENEARERMKQKEE